MTLHAIINESKKINNGTQIIIDNITNITKKIRDVLNRERNNVGKQAYSERIVQIIVNCHSREVTWHDTLIQIMMLCL